MRYAHFIYLFLSIFKTAVMKFIRISLRDKLSGNCWNGIWVFEAVRFRVIRWFVNKFFTRLRGHTRICVLIPSTTQNTRLFSSMCSISRVELCIRFIRFQKWNDFVFQNSNWFRVYSVEELLSLNLSTKRETKMRESNVHRLKESRKWNSIWMHVDGIKEKRKMSPTHSHFSRSRQRHWHHPWSVIREPWQFDNRKMKEEKYFVRSQNSDDKRQPEQAFEHQMDPLIW